MKKDRFWQIVMVAGLLTIVGLLLSCAPSPPATTPKAEAPKPAATEAAKPAAAKPSGSEIKLGFIQVFSGPVGDLGKRNRIALDIAVKEINAAGGIGGVPLKVIEGDDALKEDEAITLMRKMAADDKVLAVVGPFYSGSSAAAFPHAVEFKMPAIANTPLLPGVAQKVRPWGFTLAQSDAALIPPTIAAFVKQYNVKKLAAAAVTDNAYNKGLGDQIVTGFKSAGIDVVNAADPIGVKTADTDFTAAVTRLKGIQADGVILPLSSRGAGAFAVEMRRQGIQMPIVGVNTLSEGGYVATGGQAVEGTIVGTGFWETNPDPNQKKLAESFETRAKTEFPANTKIDQFIGQTYDIAQILAKVMREGGITNKPEDLAKDREIIQKGVAVLKDYPGIGGKISMGPGGEPVRDIFITTVKGGLFVRMQ